MTKFFFSDMMNGAMDNSTQDTNPAIPNPPIAVSVGNREQGVSAASVDEFLKPVEPMKVLEKLEGSGVEISPDHEALGIPGINVPRVAANLKTDEKVDADSKLTSSSAPISIEKARKAKRAKGPLEANTWIAELEYKEAA